MAATYLFPWLDDFIDSLENDSVFITLYVNCGYWKIPVIEADKDKSCFTTHSKTYRDRRMPFGFRNAPARFQCALDIFLSEKRWNPFPMYLDYINVFSLDKAQNLKDVDEIFGLLRVAMVSLKPKKCVFFRRRVDYFGYVISHKKLAVTSEPTKERIKPPFSDDCTKHRSFPRACKVCGRLICNFSWIVCPRNAILKKGVEV